MPEDNNSPVNSEPVATPNPQPVVQPTQPVVPITPSPTQTSPQPVINSSQPVGNSPSQFASPTKSKFNFSKKLLALIFAIAALIMYILTYVLSSFVLGIYDSESFAGWSGLLLLSPLLLGLISVVFAILASKEKIVISTVVALVVSLVVLLNSLFSLSTVIYFEYIYEDPYESSQDETTNFDDGTNLDSSLENTEAL